MSDDDRDDDAEETISCPYCREEIHEDSVRCPYCEQYIFAEDAATRGKPVWLIAGVVLCLLLVAVWILG